MGTMRRSYRICAISPHTVFILAGVILVIASDLFGLAQYAGAVVDYTDEVFCVLCLCGVLIHFRHKRLPKFYLYFIALIPLGLLGNLVARVETDPRTIAADVFIFCKPYILLLYMLTTVRESQIKKLYTYLMVVSKAVILIITVHAITALVFGLGAYNLAGDYIFVGIFPGTVSMWTNLSLAMIMSKKNNNRLLYFLLSAFIAIITNSGLGTLSIVGLVTIYFFLEKRRKFRWHYLLLIVPLCLWVGRNEITDYLMDSEEPRYLLFYYAFLTAFRFFPLGSGFATYASAMASQKYSALYYEYFNNRYGMSVDMKSFLMDSYYPQVIGQLGLIGTILFVWFMFLLFKNMIWKGSNKYMRNARIYLFATWAIAGLGFGTSGPWGCIVYLVLGLLYLMDTKFSDSKEAMYGKTRYEPCIGNAFN